MRTQQGVTDNEVDAVKNMYERVVFSSNISLDESAKKGSYLVCRFPLGVFHGLLSS